MSITRAFTALSIAALVATAACGSDEEPTDDPTDDGAWAACTEFRSAAQDQTDGVLTEEELRERLQKVDTYASIAEDQAVATAAHDLLSALTTHGYNAPETADAVTALGEACTRH